MARMTNNLAIWCIVCDEAKTREFGDTNVREEMNIKGRDAFKEEGKCGAKTALSQYTEESTCWSHTHSRLSVLSV